MLVIDDNNTDVHPLRLLAFAAEKAISMLTPETPMFADGLIMMLMFPARLPTRLRQMVLPYHITHSYVPPVSAQLLCTNTSNLPIC